MKIVTFVMALFFGVALVFAISKIVGDGLDVTVQASASEYQKPTRTQSLESKATGSMGSGDALVELTPVIDKNKLVVKFSINTHSVRLSGYDLTKITTLEYEGKIVKPLKASRIGGHHSSGKIVFDIGEDVRSFKIRIDGIPNVQERIYEWDVS
jgi:hypothetical protein